MCESVSQHVRWASLVITDVIIKNSNHGMNKIHLSHRVFLLYILSSLRVITFFISITYVLMLTTCDLPGAVYASLGQCIGARLVTPRLHLASWHPRGHMSPSGQHIGDLAEE